LERHRHSNTFRKNPEQIGSENLAEDGGNGIGKER
jgi:hypothetical protein